MSLKSVPLLKDLLLTAPHRGSFFCGGSLVQNRVYFVYLFSINSLKMTTLTVNINDESQINLIKKILKVFDVEIVEKRDDISNIEIIEKLENHHKNFSNQSFRKENYTKVDPQNLWSNIQ